MPKWDFFLSLSTATEINQRQRRKREGEKMNGYLGPKRGPVFVD